MTWTSILHQLEALVASRPRLFRVQASEENLALLLLVFPKPPRELIDMLRLFDGEHLDNDGSAIIPGCQLLCAALIAHSGSHHRVMIEQEETLPSCFTEFIPFMQTDLKSMVGVFSESSSCYPGEVVELHYESGEIAIWASSFAEFMEHTLRAQTQGLTTDIPGSQFPPEGRPVIDIMTLPGWPAE